MTPERILYMAQLAKGDSITRGILASALFLSAIWFVGQTSPVLPRVARWLTGWPFWTCMLVIDLGLVIYAGFFWPGA